MNDLIRLGKISYWATSNWEASQLERAFGIANKLGLQGPVVDQAKYSMLQRYSAEVELPYTMDYYKLGVVAYKILADQLLTSFYADKTISDISKDEIMGIGRYTNSGLTPEEKAKNVLEKMTKLQEIAKEHDLALSQLAIAWVLKNKYISSAIMSTRNIQRIEENVKAVDFKIDVDLDTKISSILVNEPSPELSYKYVGYWYNKKLVTESTDKETTFPPHPNKF
jgi:aryl-alcohol dehydrogenase-like predicted oxidoreductase